jgi:Holliday junction resolvase RusA-like endonuclease
MHELIFKVPGKPVGKGRPRFVTKGKGGKPLPYPKTYTPKTTKEYEHKVIKAFLQAAGRKLLLRCPVHIDIVAHYYIPQSASKIDRAAMLNGKLLPTKKPDLDNVAKIILDALNGIAWQDDSQVCELTKRKRFGDPPRVWVRLRWHLEEG